MRIAPLTRFLCSAAVAVTVLAAGQGGAASAGTAAAVAPRPATAGGPPVPVLHWRACPPAGYQCATARVPLDYRHPHGAAISIAMIRHQATGPGRALGSLFFNPGGPGGPGTVVLPAVYSRLPA